MLGESIRIVNHTDKLEKGSKNRIQLYKDENKVLHFIRSHQQLVFGMRNSRLSGTSVVELGSHELESVCIDLLLPKKGNYIGYTK